MFPETPLPRREWLVLLPASSTSLRLRGRRQEGECGPQVSVLRMGKAKS